MQLNTCLVTYPLQPISLIDDLQSLFKRVIFLPQRAGNDYNNLEQLPLPTDQDYLDTDVILTFFLPSNLKSYSQTPNLKLLQCCGAGWNQFTDFLGTVPKHANFQLSTASGIHVVSISEHVLMSVMMLLHKMVQLEAISRGQRRWAGPYEINSSSRMFIKEILGQTWGILGYGHLGREIARKANCFGAKILACTRRGQQESIGGFILQGTGDESGSLPDQWFQSTSKTSLHKFLAECDVVVNCLPASKDTYQLIGVEELKAMKETAILVNVGRGETVDTEALVKALSHTEDETGQIGTLKIGGASLDVTDPEPLPDNHPLFSLDNCIISPHMCWSSTQNFIRVVEVLKINKELMEKGEPALTAVKFS